MTETVTKLSANMTERSMTALALSAQLTGLSRTDCLNRAVQLYALYEQIKADGGQLLECRADGSTRTIELI